MICKFDRLTGSEHMLNHKNWGEMMAKQLNTTLPLPTTQQIESLRVYLEAMAGLHEKDCPADDTCECKYRRVNDDLQALASRSVVTPAPDSNDLAMLVRRLVQRVRKYNVSDPVASSAVDYLIRHDKGGSILERQVER
jgi:hypothetical protein